MLLIVAHHYVVNSGVISEMSQSPLSGKSIYLYFLGMWGKTGINCFVLITGYFMCKSSITIRKFLKLILEVVFYNVVIWIIFYLCGYADFSLKQMLFDFSPVKGVSKDFISCFILFYLFIPYLNVLVKNLTQKLHFRYVILCLGIYTLLGSIPKIDFTFNYITWFSILYMIASYIRIYGLRIKISYKGWLRLTVLSAILAMSCVLVILYFNERYSLNLQSPYKFVGESNEIFAVIISICSFMFFKELPIKQSKIINTISASTFGVLCIHENGDTMRQWLWNDMVKTVVQFNSGYILIYSLVTIVGIFTICIFIDYIRIHTIENVIFRYVDSFLDSNKY